MKNHSPWMRGLLDAQSAIYNGSLATAAAEVTQITSKFRLRKTEYIKGYSNCVSYYRRLYAEGIYLETQIEEI